MSSVDILVIPTLNACSFPSAITAWKALSQENISQGRHMKKSENKTIYYWCLHTCAGAQVSSF